ncbi:lectin subunit alpha-like [Contarinia nasturtii]|uniref:lectin subunit alpha-like n=1 Tax=Contarinia nasturtii TaxID=265458 RepID=UPI0012D4BCFD|nr:lectin subunit alpha-like [Contarinia nasturtii]
MKSSIVFCIVLAVVVPIFGAPNSKDGNTKRYHMEPFFKTNWYRSMAFCHNMGMRLISIQSEEEQEKIVNIINEAGHHDESFWMAATNLGDTIFYWFDTGKKISFKNWARGEPDNDRRQCIALYNEKELLWNDIDCNEQHRIICEEDIKTNSI